MKHTKGPWHIKENGGKANLVGVASNSSNWFIAEECLMEDAHLIAAAPEMLEALKELVNLVEDIKDGDYAPDTFTTQPAKAAIAKAEGK